MERVGDGGGGGGGGRRGFGGGGGEIIYRPLRCHHQNDSCIKMGRDESHFNVSLIVRGSHQQDSVHSEFEPKSFCLPA